MARRSAAHYLPGMAGEHVHPDLTERSAIFSRAEIRWLGAIVISAVVVSATAALVSDLTTADLLRDGSPPGTQPPSARG